MAIHWYVSVPFLLPAHGYAKYAFQIYNAQEQSWRDGPAFPLADAIVVELRPQSLYVVGGREPRWGKGARRTV